MVSQITWAPRSRQKKKIQPSSLEFQKQTATLTQPWSSTLAPFVLRRDPSCFLRLFRSGKTSGWNGENFVKYMTSWLVKYMCFLVKSMTCEIHDLSPRSQVTYFTSHVFHKKMCIISQMWRICDVQHIFIARATSSTDLFGEGVDDAIQKSRRQKPAHVREKVYWGVGLKTAKDWTGLWRRCWLCSCIWSRCSLPWRVM